MSTKKNYFNNKAILITGGSGSIGVEIIKSLLPLKPKTIIVFSRDEYKHHKLSHELGHSSIINYVLGDVRDLDSLLYATKDIDIIYHCAALKHVSMSELMPEEFIKTNVLGAINVKKAAIANKVSTVVSISSDKAVNPNNLMGLTKAAQEKIFISNSLGHQKGFRFINTRFGNVTGTKGSIFPIIYHQISNKLPITVTHPKMTRFYMSPTEAVELIFWATVNSSNGDTVIKKMESIETSLLIEEFLKITKNKTSYSIKETGIRVGEKMHESLITEDELYRITDKNGYLIISPYEKSNLKEDRVNSDTKGSKNLLDFKSNNKINFMDRKSIQNLIKHYIKERSKLNYI